MKRLAPGVLPRISRHIEGIEIEVWYDGECPFCSSYAAYARLRASVEKLTLRNLRDFSPSEVQSLRELGVDPELGVVLVIATPNDLRVLQGAEAMGYLSTLDNRWALLGILLRAMRIRWLGRMVFPVLAFGRRIVLKISGIDPRF